MSGRKDFFVKNIPFVSKFGWFENLAGAKRKLSQIKWEYYFVTLLMLKKKLIQKDK